MDWYSWIIGLMLGIGIAGSWWVKASKARDEARAKLERVLTELQIWEVRQNESLVTLSVGAIKNLISYIKGEV